MADALISYVLNQLATVIQQEVRLVLDVDEDIDKLATTFRAIKAVLKDAQNKQIKDELVKLWLEEFKDVTYDIDDLLDEWITEIHVKAQVKETKDAPNIGKKNLRSFLCYFGLCFNEVGLRHDIGSRIKEIRERVEFIATEKEKYRLIHLKSNDEGPERLQSSSLIDASGVFGRDFEKDIIVSKLLGETGTSSAQETNLSHPTVISIVGMGGVGKTTLAQLVFNDVQVKAKFEMTIWICVSDPFDINRITSEIIREAGRSDINPSEWNSLHKLSSQTLKGKRFLLVLDDIWTEDQAKWEPLELALMSGAPGCRVLVTTRNEKAAKMMKTSYTHYLGTISDDDCWSILRRMSFSDRKSEGRDILRKIGIEIAKKCQGLPIAAKILGSLLYFKSTEEDWQNVLESEIWEFDEVEQSFLKPALLLSYYDLPPPLQGCFSYCAIFPKDCIIKKNELIKLWMAQGFLNPYKREEMERVGEEYFNTLVMRSLFQDLSKDDDGNIISCRMHHLVHDVAVFLTKNECSIGEYNTHLSNYSSKLRHLTLLCDWSTDQGSYLATIFQVKKLRTLQLGKTTPWASPRIRDVPSAFFHNHRCLRVLCFNNIGLGKLSNEIGILIHLRYLDLSANDCLEELPDSLTALYNLQTLNLKGCRNLCRLPQEMWRLINLRHLHVGKTPSLRFLPQGFRKLTTLQTLSRFVVCEGARGCKIAELKDLIHLKGKLEISGLDRVKTSNEAFEAELMKKNILSLILDFKSVDEVGTETNMEMVVDRMNDVLKELQPHPKLMKLGIRDFLGSIIPSWISSSKSMLSHLQSLELRDCINCTELPAIGELPSLATLRMYGLNKLKQIGIELYCTGANRSSYNVAFPKLKDLEICDMKVLEFWDLGDGEKGLEVMPCVRNVKLDCQRLKTFPALWKLPSLEVLHIKTTGDMRNIEFHGNGGQNVDMAAFPKLVELHIHDNNLEVWNLSDGARKIMPCLQRLQLDCPKLKSLPALGRLPSLEILDIKTAGEVTHIKHEFYGISIDGEEVDRISFPKLKWLNLDGMEKLEEWDFGDIEEAINGGAVIIMPCLFEVHVGMCKKLKTLRTLAKLPSLEVLHLSLMYELKYIIDLEPYGRLGSGYHRVSSGVILFPKLKELHLDGMNSMEVLYNGVNEGVEIMPCLVHLRLRCAVLKSLPPQLLNIEVLVLQGCPSLSRLPYLPKLKDLTISFLFSSPELPRGLAQFKQLQKLALVLCRKVTRIPEEVKHLTSLQELYIMKCGILRSHCREGGEDWSIISHIPNISVDDF